MFKFIVFVC